MATHVTVTMEFTDRPIASLRTRLDKTDKREALRALESLTHAVVSGAQNATVRACIASACATATVTCAYASASDGADTVVIGGTTLTSATSGNGTTTFTIGSTDAAMATNLAACINANTTLQKIVRASASSAVVTITSVYPGPIGNLVTLTEGGNGCTVSGAALSSGASDEVDAYQLGYAPSV